MLISLACLPLTYLTGFGLLPALAAAILSSPAVVVYSIHKGPFYPTLQFEERVLTYTSTALVAIYFMIVALTILHVRLETYFDTTPWRDDWAVDGKGNDKTTTGSSRTCPFSGTIVNRRCPSCGCSVNKKAFKVPRRWLLEFLGQQEVLLWKAAKAAVEVDDELLALDERREELDTLLGFTGNACTLSVASSCVGCHTWQLCFNVGRRLSLSLALASLFFAFLPWAFGSFFEVVGVVGIVFKVMSGVLAQVLAAAALALETKLMARAISFLQEYSWMPKPNAMGAMPSLLKKGLKLYHR